MAAEGISALLPPVGIAEAIPTCNETMRADLQLKRVQSMRARAEGL